MKTYRLPMGWQIALPEDWTNDYSEDSGENRFAPPDQGITLTLTAFHAEKAGMPAPAEIMRSVFLHQIGEQGKSLPVPPELNAGACETALRQLSDTEISAGTFCAGELLLTRITGSDPQQVYQAIAYLALIAR